MYFKREKSVSVFKDENDFFRAVVRFVDNYHDFEMIVVSDNDLFVKSCEIEIKNKPYETCNAIKNIVKRIEGIKIEHGLTKKANILMGGSEGCIHMIDMFIDASRGLVQARLKFIEEKYGIERFYNELKGSCISY